MSKLGGLPKPPNKSWYLISGSKYSTEFLHPSIRSETNTTVIDKGIRNIDATNLPTDSSHVKGYHLTQHDLKMLTPNADMDLDTTKLRPVDNPFLALFPHGTRPLTRRVLAKATPHFLATQGMSNLKPGPLGKSLPEHYTESNSFSMIAVLGIGVGTYLLLAGNNYLIGGGLVIISIAGLKFHS